MTIDEASDPGDIETARRLFEAYAGSLPFSLDFQNFAEELAFRSLTQKTPLAGLVPAIHVFGAMARDRKTWVPGAS